MKLSTQYCATTGSLERLQLKSAQSVKPLSSLSSPSLQSAKLVSVGRLSQYSMTLASLDIKQLKSAQSVKPLPSLSSPSLHAAKLVSVGKLAQYSMTLASVDMEQLKSAQSVKLLPSLSWPSLQASNVNSSARQGGEPSQSVSSQSTKPSLSPSCVSSHTTSTGSTGMQSVPEPPLHAMQRARIKDEPSRFSVIRGSLSENGHRDHVRKRKHSTGARRILGACALWREATAVEGLRWGRSRQRALCQSYVSIVKIPPSIPPTVGPFERIRKCLSP